MPISAHVPETVRRCREEILRRIPGVRAEIAHPASKRAAEIAVDVILSRAIAQSLRSDEDVDLWIKDRRKSPSLHASIIPLDRVEGWRIGGETGNISHGSGKFYSIIGVQARHRTRDGDLEWDQPIIDQPEIGILGILAMPINGVLHFCLQAKAEPGTLHSIQLAPTVQATYSNYTGVHGGSLPPFVPYFISPPKERVVFAKLQTEDGGRFLFKSNRNMVVLVNEGEIQRLPDGFIWLSLRQISRLIRNDNLINACCRSVLAGLFFGRLPAAGAWMWEHIEGTGLPPDAGVADVPESPLRETFPRTAPGCGSWPSYAELVQWIDDMKMDNHMLQKRVPLNSLRDWHMDGNGHIVYKTHRFFSILGLRVRSGNREVGSWCQPIIDNVSTGIIGLLVRKGVNGPEFLMQAKAEVGNRSAVQIAPTVQFTQENYLENEKLAKPFLFEEFLSPRQFHRIAETRQSEEGARFYHEEHVHRILMLPAQYHLDIPSGFRWLAADEIRFLLNMGEQVNSCARSILACLI